MIHLANWDNFQ